MCFGLRLSFGNWFPLLAWAPGSTAAEMSFRLLNSWTWAVLRAAQSRDSIRCRLQAIEELDGYLCCFSAIHEWTIEQVCEIHSLSQHVRQFLRVGFSEEQCASAEVGMSEQDVRRYVKRFVFRDSD